MFAIVCVPLMLLVKPLCCRPTHKAQVSDEIEFARISQGNNESNAINGGEDGAEEILIERQRQMKSINDTLKNLAGDGGNHDFGEVFVH